MPLNLEFKEVKVKSYLDMLMKCSEIEENY